MRLEDAFQTQKEPERDAMDVARRFEALLEVAFLSLIYYLVWLFLYDDRGLFPPYLGRGKYVLAGVYAVTLYLFCHLNDGFQFGKMKISDIIISQVISMIFADIVAYFQLSLIANVMVNFVPILVLMVFESFAIVGICLLYHRIYVMTHEPRRMLMIYGRKSSPKQLENKLAERPDKYQMVRSISADEGIPAIRRAAEDVDAVILNDITAKVRNDILKLCFEQGIRTYIVPKVSDILVRGGEDIGLFDTPLILVRGRGVSRMQRHVKRAMDVLLCSIAMIPALPIMGAVAIAIKCDDHGPVFFRQERVTEAGRRFMILKFRSMSVQASEASEAGEVKPTVNDDDRITRVGRFIRPTRLDELPQLFNILKGEMSLVGPRPERTEHVEKYLDEIPEFIYRYKVPAGLTGYAQIYGRYNTTAYDKLRLDLMYIEQYSLLLDFKLILMTVRILFKKESTEGFSN